MQAMRLGKKFILLFLLALVIALPALPAWAGEALVNSEVDVDVTGKDAADARAKAMAKGEIDALSDLLSKLATPEQAQAIISNQPLPYFPDPVLKALK